MSQPPTLQQADLTNFIAINNNRAILKYFQNVQLKYMQMDNFGLSLDDAGEIKKPKPIFLRDLFVAPHLSSRHLDPEQLITFESKTEETQTDTRPDWQSIVDVLEQHPCSFVLGDPGTGKTTLIHWLMLAFATSSNNLTKITLGELVPFALILRELPLREVDSFNALWQVFTAHNQDVMQAFEQYPEPSSVIERLLNSGQALILLDGLDEITHDDTRKRLGAAVLEGMQCYPACRFVISSRVVGFDQRQLFGLAMNEAETRALTDKPLLPVSYLAPFTYPQAQQFVSNWYQQYHPNLDGNHAPRVAELFTRMQKNDGLGRLSRIPVLLNMICFIHARRGRMPDGRAELYQRIAETYLVTLDTARSISPYRGDSKVVFDYTDRSDWLSEIALTMQESRSKDETAILMPEAQVRATLAAKLAELDVPQAQINDEVSFLLRNFAERSGLFLPRGEGLYGFSHLSFLEYFAAKALKRQAILGEIDWADLGKKAQLVWWQETLVLFFEQLEDAKLAAKYVELLFPTHVSELKDLDQLLLKSADLTEAQITAQTLLAAIVMDSGVKLTLTKRQELIAKLWEFYLQIPFDRYFQTRWALVKRLWQTDFESIAIGLTAMKEVTALDLSFTDLADLSLLAGLTQLRMLGLSGTPVSDISALAGLAQLQHLWLTGTQVSDVSVLAGLTQLQVLWLGNIAVSDVSALAGLTQLKDLYLGGTPVSDVSALAGLTQLQHLDLRGTQVSDVSTLSGLTQLRELNLNVTQVSDVSVLAGLTQLQHLYLRGTKVSDVSALAGLTQLEIHS